MVEDGTLIWLDYDAWYIDPNGEKVLFDTTHEDMAKEHNIYREGVHYGPVPLIVGQGDVIYGLEEALKEANVDEEKEIEIPPEKGFGQRDPKLVQLMPIHKILSLPQFRGDNAKMPEVGMEVDFGDRKGTIIQLTASRVRIDFNPKYAGKTLVYKFKITKVAETREDKVKGAIAYYYRDPEEFSFEFGDDEVTIKLSDLAKVDHNWFHAKLGIVGLIRQLDPELKTIRFLEEYVKKEKKEEKAEEESAAEESSESSEEEEKAEDSENTEEKQEGEEKKEE